MWPLTWCWWDRCSLTVLLRHMKASCVDPPYLALTFKIFKSGPQIWNITNILIVTLIILYFILFLSCTYTYICLLMTFKLLRITFHVMHTDTSTQMAAANFLFSSGTRILTKTWLSKYCFYTSSWISVYHFLYGWQKATHFQNKIILKGF